MLSFFHLVFLFDIKRKRWNCSSFGHDLPSKFLTLMFLLSVATQKFKPSLAYGVKIPDRIGPREGISFVRLQPLYDALGLGSD